VLSWDGAAGQTVPCGTQKEYGLELEAAYHTDKTQLLVSHGYTKLYAFDLAPGQHTYLTAKPYGYGDDLANWSNHITKLTLQHKLDDKWTFDASMRIYWGFPGMKDSDEYWPYNASPAYVGTNLPMVEDGWEKAYRGDYYLNMGLRYQPSKDLTIGVMGYNLLGIFNKDLNKRNYITSNGYSNGGDYRNYAPAVGVSLTYKF
jgi:iron complex outermembrane receptor protein